MIIIINSIVLHCWSHFSFPQWKYAIKKGLFSNDCRAWVQLSCASLLRLKMKNQTFSPSCCKYPQLPLMHCLQVLKESRGCSDPASQSHHISPGAGEIGPANPPAHCAEGRKWREQLRASHCDFTDARTSSTGRSMTVGAWKRDHLFVQRKSCPGGWQLLALASALHTT